MKKNVGFLFALAALLALLTLSSSAASYTLRPYTEEDKNVAIRDGVVYRLVDNEINYSLFPDASRDEHAPRLYYEVIDYFDTIEHAESATAIKILPEIDGIPVKRISLIRFGKESFPNVKSITLPEGLMEAGNYAFSALDGLETVKLPQSLRIIGQRAFAGMAALKTITIPDSVTSMSIEAFMDCKKLETVKYSDAMTSYPTSIFLGCKSLKTVTGGLKVTRVGWGAFNGCSKLTHVGTDRHLTAIQGEAFKNCTSFKNFTHNTGDYFSSGIYGSADSIGDYAFYNCTNLAYKVDSYTTDLGDHAFTNSGVKSVLIGGATMRGDSTFKNCKRLERVEFYPTAYIIIADKAFANCKALKTVILPCGGNFIEIGGRAFQNCTALTGVYFNSRKAVSEYCVNAIDGRAFQGCTSLTTFTISAAASDIRLTAFEGCTALKKVRVKQTDAEKIARMPFFKKLPKDVTVVAANEAVKAAIQKIGFKGKIKINESLAHTR